MSILNFLQSKSRKVSFFSAVLCWVLILQVGVGYSVLAVAQDRASTPFPHPSRARSNSLASKVLKNKFGGPLFEPGGLYNHPMADFLYEVEMPELKMAFEANDPLLDQDPYFLRAQSWQASEKAAGNVENDEPEFKNEASGTSVKIPGADKIWNINLPVHAVGNTDEYIFLAANKDSTIFEKGGEGIFVVSYQALIDGLGHAKVPVFFFPLPGTGWIGNIQVHEVISDEETSVPSVFIASTEGDVLPVDLEDIRELIKTQNLMYMFSLGLALKAVTAKLEAQSHDATSQIARQSILADIATLAQTGKNLDANEHVARTQNIVERLASVVGVHEFYPPRGSTALYGSVYTGLNLDEPQFSDQKFLTASVVAKKASLLASLSLIPLAHADDAPVETPAQKLVDKLIRAGAIVSLAFVGSIALKYGHKRMREKFAKKHDIQHTKAIQLQGLSLHILNHEILTKDLKVLFSQDDITKFLKELHGIEVAYQDGLARVGKENQDGLRAVADERVQAEMKVYNAIMAAHKEPTYSADPKAAKKEKTLYDNAMNGIKKGIARLQRAREKAVLENTAKFSSDPKMLAALFKREAKDIGTTFAHSLTLFAQFACAWFGRLIEYTGDRFIPSIASAENTTIRKVLSKTVYFASNNTNRTPVNYKTLIQGTIVMGWTDSLLVTWQLFQWVPAISHALAWLFPYAFFTNRVHSAFDGANSELTAQNNIFEGLRNWINYTTGGASSYAVDRSSIFQERIKLEVRDEMRKEGKNPDKEPTEFQSRYDAKLAVEYDKNGLPGKEEFLFDAGTFYEWCLSWTGISKPDYIQKMPGSLNKEAADPILAGLTRPGLLISSVKKAAKRARAEAAANPRNLEKIDAARIYDELLNDLSPLEAFVKNPMRVLFYGAGSFFSSNMNEEYQRAKAQLLTLKKRFYEAKHAFIALSYEGPVSADILQLPGSAFQKLARPGARYASYLFRATLFGYRNGESYIVTPEIRAEHSHKAELAAMLDLRSKHAAEYDALINAGGLSSSEASEKLKAAHPDEYTLRIEERMIVAERKKQRQIEIDSFEPEAKGRFEKKQIARAMKVADTQLAQLMAGIKVTLTGEDKDEGFSVSVTGNLKAKFENDADRNEAWKKLYALAYANEVGVFPFFEGKTEAETQSLEELATKIEAKTQEITEKELSTEENIAFMKKLDGDSQLKYSAEIYAKNFVKSYVELVTSLEANIPAISPAQPGRFQKLRQSHILRGSGFFARAATRGVRFLEALYSDASYGPGYWENVYRTKPFIYDLKLSNTRYAQKAVTYFTAIYYFNLVVWGMALPFPLLVLSLATAFTILAPSQVLTRAFLYNGIKPMGGMLTYFLYALVYSVMTFWGEIPKQIFAGDFVWMLTTHPIISAAVLGLGAFALVAGGDNVSRWAHNGASAVVNGVSAITSATKGFITNLWHTIRGTTPAAAAQPPAAAASASGADENGCSKALKPGATDINATPSDPNNPFSFWKPGSFEAYPIWQLLFGTDKTLAIVS